MPKLLTLLYEYLFDFECLIDYSTSSLSSERWVFWFLQHQTGLVQPGKSSGWTPPQSTESRSAGSCLLGTCAYRLCHTALVLGPGLRTFAPAAEATPMGHDLASSGG